MTVTIMMIIHYQPDKHVLIATDFKIKKIIKRRIRIRIRKNRNNKLTYTAQNKQISDKFN